MIEIRVPKEIKQYEAKLIGPLTMRQSVICAIFTPICVLTYHVVRSFASFDAACFAVMLPAALIALFGWVRPYGMKMEVFLRSIFINIVIAPSKRPYVTENYFEQFSDFALTSERMEEIEKDLVAYVAETKEESKEDANQKSILLKEVDADLLLAYEDKEVEILPDDSNKKKEKKKEKRQKKEKYIKSKKAIK